MEISKKYGKFTDIQEALVRIIKIGTEAMGSLLKLLEDATD